MIRSLNWKNAIFAGIIGTIFFDLFSLISPRDMWDIPEILGEWSGLGFVFGVLWHYCNGVLFAIVYSLLVPFLWGPHWFRAISYTTVITILFFWLLFLPLMGYGIAGQNESDSLAVISLLRHWVYGLALILVINRDFTLPGK
ncbi:MAG: hypothetical protein LC662_14160 [Rhodothermaceae bacterium]|nr:hypothetical protein [Rhodothermaceae bacterium]